MIQVYPTKVEALDPESQEVIFTMETFDACAATIELRQNLIGPSNIDNLTAAMRRAIVMLELI